MNNAFTIKRLRSHDSIPAKKYCGRIDLSLFHVTKQESQENTFRY
ncbi:hypothetical protein [Rhodocytophaga rosea]|nr:hypothetical protein [Rhodocytophaga rosea]